MRIANYLLRLSLIALYLLAAFGPAFGLSASATQVLRVIALGTLLVHAGELAIFTARVRHYRGPMAVSVLLTMLFGLLHWGPLKAPAGI